MSIKSKFWLTIIIASLAASGCSGEKSSQEHFELGESYRLKGATKSAVIEYRNSIRVDPSNNKARLILGKLYLDSWQYLAARKELTRAFRDEALSGEAIMPLAQATFKLNLHQELLDLPLMEMTLSNDDLIVAYVLRGQALMALGKKEPALSQFNSANNFDSKSAFSRLGQGVAALSSGDVTQALAIIKLLHQDQPEMPEAMLLLGRLSFSVGEFEAAITVYDKYLSYKQYDPANVPLLLAESLLNNGDFSRAKIELDKLFAANERHPIVNALMSHLAYQEKDYQAALDYASTALAVMPNQSTANLAAGLASFRLNKHQDSYRYLSQFEKDISGTPVAKIVQIINTIKIGNIDKAKRALTRLSVIDEKNVNLYIVAANEFAIAQDYRTSLKLLEQAQPFFPADNQLLLKIGVLKVKVGEPTGLDDLAVVVLDPELVDEVVPQLVRAFVAAKRYGRLQQIAEDLKIAFPHKSHGWDISGALAIVNKDYQLATKLFRTNIEKFPENMPALLSLANLLTKDNDHNAAMAYIEQALLLKPDNYLALKFKAKLKYRQSKDLSQYKQILVDAYNKFPESELLIIERATIFNYDNESDKAIALLESIKEREKLSQHYWNRYGDLLAKAGKPQQALSIYHQWSEREPNSPTPLLKQILMSERLGRYKEGLRLIEVASQKMGSSSDLNGAKISLMIKDGQLGSARRLLNSFKEINGNQKYVSVLEGQLLYREKKFAQAVPHLADAYAVNKDKRFALLLANAHVSSGEAEQALDVLKQHLELEPLERSVTMMMAQIYSSIKSPLAIELYSELVASSPNNPVLLNNLAWSLSEHGQPEKALKLVEKAIEIMPDNIDIIDTYGVILQKLNKPELAKIQFSKVASLKSQQLKIDKG